MHDDIEPTRDELDDIEADLAVRAHSPRFWDADAGELVAADPWEHPSWDVADALEDGWDDPADAVEVREQLPQEYRPRPPRPGCGPLSLVPVAPDGYWPARDGDDDQEPEVQAA
ncbi:hypothetical protein [Nocardiopsis dassonvillei]|uniref:hypothetical protein n=1 Tax=Nocardiopsis dassonvillei TaxID=2014 RepID=UPI003F544148